MIEKTIRNSIINQYNKKEDRIFVGNLIDILNEFIMENHLVHTRFLNIHEQNIAISILNKLNVKYKTFNIIEDIERTIIFLIPDYLEKDNINNIYNQYVAFLKITPAVKNKLKHKDYMGALYSLGITENMIGDIFVVDGIAYTFIFKDIIGFIKDNLVYVSNVKVYIECLNLDDENIGHIKINFETLKIKVSSLRVDVILAEVYNLSRSEVKKKVENGDLVLNSSSIYYLASNLKENDIVSFRRCGKIKVGKIIGSTKNNKIILEIKKYN